MISESLLHRCTLSCHVDSIIGDVFEPEVDEVLAKVNAVLTGFCGMIR